MRRFTLCLHLAIAIVAHDWQIVKNYDLSDMAAIRTDWTIELLPPGWNEAMSAFVDDPLALFTRNGNVIIRAYRLNGSYFSASLISKQTFTPADYTGSSTVSLRKM